MNLHSKNNIKIAILSHYTLYIKQRIVTFLKFTVRQPTNRPRNQNELKYDADKHNQILIHQ